MGEPTGRRIVVPVPPVHEATVVDPFGKERPVPAHWRALTRWPNGEVRLVGEPRIVDHTAVATSAVETLATVDEAAPGAIRLDALDLKRLVQRRSIEVLDRAIHRAAAGAGFQRVDGQTVCSRPPNLGCDRAAVKHYPHHGALAVRPLAHTVLPRPHKDAPA